MNPAYKEHEFEALKLRYEDQVELSREITKLEFQIFSGYVTIQIILGGWLIAHPLKSLLIQIGMLLVDSSLTGIAIYMFYSSYQRRLEVIGTIRNINRALGFTEKGIYLPEAPINAPPSQFRPFWWAYCIGIIICFLGIVLIIIGGVMV